MKYIKKIVALVIGIALFAAVIICIGRIFAVRNINVTLVTYDEDSSESYEKAKTTLKPFKGESIVFISSDDVAEKFKDSNFTVTSCVKKYPCTINVVLKERLEIFAVSVGGQYSMYDDEGKFLRKYTVNENVNDGSPNVKISGAAEDEIGEVARIAAAFKNKFKALRSLVSEITLDTDTSIDDYTERLIFGLRCGLKIQLDNYSEYTEEKIKASYEEFSKLTDKDKLNGVLRSYHRLDGEVKAVYTNI